VVCWDVGKVRFVLPAIVRSCIGSLLDSERRQITSLSRINFRSHQDVNFPRPCAHSKPISS
jgi:hypothetical protein